ncbi:hypothetical protein KKG31_05255 [Patescibacteria group bacterium]|nr:hypothetical protein [Patescibacteria group bacterium]MBU1758528.1 hypothetical protein [Patescibacteria group bacterium]
MKKFILITLSCVFMVVLSGCVKTPTNIIASTNLNTFAQCLTDAGAKMYGTAACSHCLAQKVLFGDSFQYVNYIDCQEDPNACTDANINKVPTWAFADDTQTV